MPKLKTYATYKNSGTDFIGNIPDEWAVVKLKYVATILSGYSFKSDDFIDDGIPIIRISDIKKEINWEKTKKVSSINEKILRRFIIQENDILIAMTGATIGKTAIYKSSKKALLNQRVGILRNNSNYDVGFLGYVIESYVFREAIRVLSYGGAQENVGTNDLENIYLPLASLTVQNCIVKFLDVKTSEIDTLIEDKEELIALLEEKRQAIITEAVTKGLDPDVKMKDSDVEWIGEIPEHWKVSKLKYFAKVIMGQSIDSQSISYNNEDIPFLQGNAEFGSLHPKAKSYCSFGKKYAEKGDILLSVRAPVGALNISDKTYAIGRGLSSIRVPSKLVPFFWFALKVYKKELLSKVTGSTFDAVAIEDVKNLIFPIPSNEEMISIGKELDTYDKRTLAIIKSLRIQLVKLKEYRQALIYEAVTGKIDVQEILKETEQEEVSSS